MPIYNPFSRFYKPAFQTTSDLFHVISFYFLEFYINKKNDIVQTFIIWLLSLNITFIHFVSFNNNLLVPTSFGN